jgi:hypothetical protein
MLEHRLLLIFTKIYIVGDSLQCDLPLAIKKILIITSFGRVSFLDETIAHFGKIYKQFFETSIGVPSKIWGCLPFISNKEQHHVKVLFKHGCKEFDYFTKNGCWKMTREY